MKYKHIIFYLSLTLFPLLSIGQCVYRVKAIKILDRLHTNVSFMLPPGSKLAWEGFIFPNKELQFIKGSQFRYHYVLFRGITSEYASSAAAVNNALYVHSGSSIPPRKLRTLDFTDLLNIHTLGKYADYFLGNENTATRTKKPIIIRIDYEKLLADEKNFEEYVKDLFTNLSNLDEECGWAGSDGTIAPDIVQKIFELTPVPEKYSLGRFLAISTDKDKSFLMADPKIWLEVDNVERKDYTITSVTNGHQITEKLWKLSVNGQTIIKFFKTREGKLMQHPILNYSSTATLPSNTLENEGAYNNKSVGVRQASTADIQMSQILKSQKYMFVYQKGFRSNSSSATNIGDVLENDEVNSNSILLFSNTIPTNFFTKIDDGSFVNDEHITHSTFGIRRLINCVIPIYVNGQMQVIDLASDIYSESQLASIPAIKRIKLYRIHKSKMKRVRFYNDNTILLPNDQIIYK